MNYFNIGICDDDEIILEKISQLINDKFEEINCEYRGRQRNICLWFTIDNIYHNRDNVNLSLRVNINQTILFHYIPNKLYINQNVFRSINLSRLMVFSNKERN